LHGDERTALSRKLLEREGDLNMGKVGGYQREKKEQTASSTGWQGWTDGKKSSSAKEKGESRGHLWLKKGKGGRRDKALHDRAVEWGGGGSRAITKRRKLKGEWQKCLPKKKL